MNRPTAFCVYPLLGMLFGLWAAEALAFESDSRHAAVMSITGDEVKAYVAALADDTFEGRESGSRGNRAAGIYITERLKKFGLQPEGAKGELLPAVWELPQYPGPCGRARPGPAGRGRRDYAPTMTMWDTDRRE